MSTNYAEAVRLIKLGRRAEQRGKAVSGCLTAILVSIVVNLFHGWLFMLAVGVLHHEWWPQIPTIGYWWAVVVVLLLRGVFSQIRRAKATS